MKRLIVTVLAIMAVGVTMSFCSCKCKADPEVKTELSDEKKMESLKRDLQVTLDRYRACQEELKTAEEPLDVYVKYEKSIGKDLIEGMTFKEGMHPLCCESDWPVKLPNFEDDSKGFSSVAQDLYNTLVTTYDMNSDFEIWYREATSGTHMADSTDIFASIGRMDFTCIRDPKLRKGLEESRDELVWCINSGLDGWTEERNPSACAATLAEYLTAEYLENESSPVHVGEAFEQAVMLDADTLVAEEYARNWKGVGSWLEDMIREKDFNKCCELAVMGMRNISGDDTFWAIEVATKLINSAIYSPMLPLVWRMWRSNSQHEFGGLSRDSFIYNGFFNVYRKKVFLTVMMHIVAHPEDMQAEGVAQYMILTDNILRNGSFILGNDNGIERMNLGLRP